MSTLQHRIPSIAATSTARNAYGREALTTAKGWAARSDLSSYTVDELEKAHGILLGCEQALKPFYSPERVAYRKLSDELQRRKLAS